MIGKFAAIAAVSVLMAGQAAAAPASLAQVSGVKGNVLVSQGGKMVSASNVSSLRSGDRVVAKNGQAQVRYADGCVVSLRPNGMATIGAASPCASGAGLISASQGTAAQNPFGVSDFVGAVSLFILFTVIVVGIAESGDEDIVSP